MTRSRRARGRGFSLLELLVAMAVMALSLGMLYQVDAGVVRGVADLQAQQRATVLAQSILDSRDAVPSAGWREQGRSAEFDWAVETTPMPRPPGIDLQVPPLHEVRVAVRWQGRGGARELAVSTLLPQALPQPGETAR